MHKILISRCLLGEAVRYDGQAKRLASEYLSLWQLQGRLVPVCPEVLGGLPTPRPPAERVANKVLTAEGEDVTAAFQCGAQLAAKLAQQQLCRFALLKANSPSCGNLQIYDGSFSGRLCPGKGVSVEALQACGLQVFNEFQLEELQQALLQADACNTNPHK
ncbi:DUF523 domain-containing protein [Aliagarivorans taiwanensis]|uniref:DUF523 domain-containing protein n=1 Tax=Aliagarivorans taiwanensis TaxID=561966 RepID=UPI0003FFA0B1|nr:DUF523 domain-containing protein [Aliagarivorans taiwanensis]